MSAPCPVFGFRVLIRPVAGASDVDVAAIADDLTRVLDANDLVVGRGSVSDRSAREYIVTREGSQATNADRTLVREWSTRWTERAAVQIGDLIDLKELSA